MSNDLSQKPNEENTEFAVADKWLQRVLAWASLAALVLAVIVNQTYLAIVCGLWLAVAIGYAVIKQYRKTEIQGLRLGESMRDKPILPASRQQPPALTTGQRTIHPNFRKPYESYESELGKPRKDAEPMRRAYHARHLNAWVIWVSGRSEVYLLRHDFTGAHLRDLKVMPTEKSYYYDEDNRKRLGILEREDPPWGVIAKGWAENRDDWEWIGARKWHCDYPNKEIYQQEFDGGLIIGNFTAPDEKAATAYVFIYGDPKYRAVPLDGNWPPCSKPPTDEDEQAQWEILHPE